MKTEQEIRNEIKTITDLLKAKKYDLENTEIFGQLKGDILPFRLEYKNEVLRRTSDLYYLYWVLDEHPKDLYDQFELEKHDH